ncbi:type II CAAX endopeptidase family protein [Rhodohalobacter sulfatireducens]|uniref:CPBP family intramembrane metalloprotease n=1 Tax=Rhodohalobacter sulfatireducens TaxID=2911366 RepID=A0ABS9KC30_9BACT|nr:type II CAAX endopeptidase family protein [Rhodohalobacter sulfatireducens]MCG2588396.1 CPBP family intramembrane metalloprotease [Rhodohalobacter sulfatireducens]MDR9364240.1 type II CAAX endopeptidase family protein [Balneolaceae bacterium]MDR9407568.1 type II CAAX endopeptidase family protein [Balneolaceae bacterium]
MNQTSEPSEEYSFTPTVVRSWAEKNGFAHWVIALIWLVVVLILFQVVAGIVFVGLIMVTSGEIDPANTMASVTENIDLLFIGNSIGQILFLGLATFIVVRFNIGSESKRSFLRIKWNNQVIKYLLMGGLLIVVIQPVIIYLGYLNSLIPLPEMFSDLQVSQYEMIEDFLSTDGIIWFGLLNIALVPAICEEILFRGYILRAFEKSWGPILAVIISGLIFGMFHIQLGNILPLATLGVVLALMTWLSGTIWPAVVAHFINNGAAVLVGSQYPELLFQEMTAETLPPVWVLVGSIIFTFSIVYWMINKSKQLK